MDRDNLPEVSNCPYLLGYLRDFGDEVPGNIPDAIPEGNQADKNQRQNDDVPVPHAVLMTHSIFYVSLTLDYKNILC